MLISKFIKLFCPVFIFILIPSFLLGQEYNYTHYDVKDGLAGATVYSMVQDKDGFIWFGTETGLSRFDGSHFKNFYTNDGLPDNEILSLYVDSKNRVWMVPFKNAICYYWKGKIYNQENDSLLRQLKISSNIVSVLEDKFGNIVIAENNYCYVISPQKKVTKIDNFEGHLLTIAGVWLNESGGIEFSILNFPGANKLLAYLDLRTMSIRPDSYPLTPDFFQFVYFSPKLLIQETIKSLHLFFPKENDSLVIKLSHGFIDISQLNDSLITINTVGATYLYSINEKKIIDTFLEGQTIYSVLRDSEEDTWFSVPGKGVSKLTAGGILNFFTSKNKAVFCIQEIDSLFYIGSDNFDLWTINKRNEVHQFLQVSKGDSRGRITGIVKIGEDSIMVGTDNGLFRLTKHGTTGSFPFKPIKSIVKKPNNNILISSALGVFDVPLARPDYASSSKIWNDRATCALFANQLFYIGTISGLFTIDSSQKKSSLGDSFTVFKSRINAINRSEDGIIWIGTNGQGLIAFKDNKILMHITKDNGLASNNSRNIFVTQGVVWVGTDAGINKVVYTNSGFSITSFNSADGLGSDIINAIYADRSDVYVGTPDGLTYFNEGKITKKSICNLVITGIKVLGKDLPIDSNSFSFKHSQNDVSFQFVGISFKSAGKITYRYRLIGLDSNWKNGADNNLDYQALPSGEYTFQVQAFNKFGVASKLKQVHFAIAKTLWEKTWFRLLLIALLVLGTWFVVDYRIRLIKEREYNKSLTIKRIAELEQMALRSQMNPHFIFNCLNSIQHYVISNDILQTNEFISNFSRLIRMTLDNSSKKEISIKEEVEYISAYLPLEQKRYENKFTFEVVIAENIHNYMIPPMMLQPYLENAVRHGVRYLGDGKGKIAVSFRDDGTYVVCSISDNGIGRALSKKLKSNNPIEYQSKGMDLTARRIEMYNTINSSKIIIDIQDLGPEGNEPVGTLISIWFPILKD
jgi:hypothetical protein